MDLRHSFVPGSLRLVVVSARGGRHVRVDVGGELDGTTAGQLIDATTHIVRASTPELVEFDVAGLTFLDSAGLRGLLTCLAAVQEAGGRLTLGSPSRQVAQILVMTDLLEHFGLAADVRPGPPAPVGGRTAHSGGAVPDLAAHSDLLVQAARETRARARALRGQGLPAAG